MLFFWNYQKNRGRNFWQRGQAMLVSAVFFLLISASVVVGLISPAMRNVSIALDNLKSKQVLVLAESGAEDVFYRILSGKNTQPSSTIILPNGASVTTTLSMSSNTASINSTAGLLGRNRKITIDLRKQDSVQLKSYLLFGKGGLYLRGSSSLIGGVTSSGPIVGTNSNRIKLDTSPSASVISSGYGGLINQVRVINNKISSYAHSITNSALDGIGYYYTDGSGTSFNGGSVPYSMDRVMYPPPITDAMIDNIEKSITNTYTGACPYNMNKNQPYTLNSSIIIPCDLNLSNGATLTINGNVWVKGKVSVASGSSISANTGSSSLAIIADNPDDRTSGSRIEIDTSANLSGSGHPLLLISRNNAMSNDPNSSTYAINLIQCGANSKVVLYAKDGGVDVELSDATEGRRSVVGYKGVMGLSNSNATLGGQSGSLSITLPVYFWVPALWKEAK